MTEQELRPKSISTDSLSLHISLALCVCVYEKSHSIIISASKAVRKNQGEHTSEVLLLEHFPSSLYRAVWERSDYRLFLIPHYQCSLRGNASCRSR